MHLEWSQGQKIQQEENMVKLWRMSQINKLASKVATFGAAFTESGSLFHHRDVK